VISISDNGDIFDDFISFIDDDGKKKEWYVHVTDIGDVFVTFIIKSGKSVTIPSSRIIKIKQAGGKPNDGSR